MLPWPLHGMSLVILPIILFLLFISYHIYPKFRKTVPDCMFGADNSAPLPMASSTQRASPPIHLTSSSWRYDVFLSFRGKDTRKSFIGHLHKALQGKTIINVFKDDLQLETGSTISKELLTAIEESRFAIIVISQDYASSKSCLEELVKILECMKERKTIVPIFYNVDPSDVKHQTGTFGEAFKKHAKDGRVEGWKTALTTVGGISGKDLAQYRLETELIEEIVDEIYNKLVCAGCHRRVGDGLNCLGAVWHRACLLTLPCEGCKRPFTDLNIRECGDQPYHERCYELEYLVCNVCKKSIQDGQVEHKQFPFWGRRYCSSHVNDGTPWCCSCERLKPRDTSYYNLDDGRKLCPECKESHINTDKGCLRSICLDVRHFFKKLNVKVDKIPVRLVSRQVIIDAKEGNDGSDHRLPVLRAVCLFEERTVTGALIGRPNQLCCEVKEILIWHGLPRILTGSLIAQLMMRAWLRLSCCPNMSPEVEKGVSRYFALRWLLEYSNSSTKLSEFEKKLFMKRKIELDCGALVTTKKEVYKHGLGMTLETIRKTGNFPSVNRQINSSLVLTTL